MKNELDWSVDDNGIQQIQQHAQDIVGLEGTTFWFVVVLLLVVLGTWGGQ